MWLWRATIRIHGGHDFTAEVRAPDQIAARAIFARLYGSGSIIGNNVWRV